MITKRSPKIKLLFWLSFATVFLYITIIFILLQTFVLPDEAPLELPTQRVTTILILYGIMALTALIGTVLSIFISNRKYMKLFGAFIIIIFGSIIVGKSILG